MSADSAFTAAIGSGAAFASREIAERVVKAIAKKASTVEQIFKNDFKIEGQEMTILCPEKVQKYSIAVVPEPSKLLPKSVEFPIGVPRRVELRPVRGLSHIKDAINITQNGFRLDLKSLVRGELYILDIEYPIEDHKFIDALVERSIPRDVPHVSNENVRKYEMSAQLKHLGVLKRKYYSVNLRDLPFVVDVAIHHDVRVTVPGIYTKQLETFVEITKKKGRSEKFKDLMQLQRLQKLKYGGVELDILRDLFELFTPTRFRQFIEVLRDFCYSDCMRGSDFYDTLPFPTWPKTMKVISRTDLNLDKPAADGTLVYRHNDFISEIKKLFDIDQV